MDRYIVWLPLSLLAGWATCDCIFNWSPFVKLQSAIEPYLLTCLLLVALGAAAVYMTKISGGNYAYAFGIVWACAWICFENLSFDSGTMSVAVFAGLVAVVEALAVLKFNGKEVDLKKNLLPK